MTNAIEQTKRVMYMSLTAVKNLVGQRAFPTASLPKFECCLEAHLEELRKDRAVVAEERDTMRNQLQALQMASSTAAEVIRGLRRELEEAREGVTAADGKIEAGNASSELVDANALMIILGAMVDAQRVMTDWLVPDGIGAKKAMSKIVAALGNEPLFLAIRKFEEPKPAA